MVKKLFVLAALAASMLAGAARAETPAANDVFRIGVAPHTSARVIIEQYQPIRAAVEKAVGMPVEIVTAPDFTEFARRGLAQEYDIAITTGHQAQLLRQDAEYLPLITYKANFTAVVVVPKGSTATGAASLTDTTLLGLNPSSLVTLWGLHWLKDNNVTPKQVRYVSAADSVAQLLLAGDGSAGFISQANFQKLTPEVQAQLRILVESAPMAGRVYMLNKRDAARQADISKALWAFAKTPEGLHYFSENKLEGYRDITGAELQTMERYSDEVRQLLKAGAR
jgi:phosphonate transport system substrate-binding protein